MDACVNPFWNRLNRHRLPCEWIEILKCKYRRAADRQAWSDANIAYAAYKSMQESCDPVTGIMDVHEMPEPVDFAAFSDVEKERDTRRSGEGCYYDEYGMLQETPLE